MFVRLFAHLSHLVALICTIFFLNPNDESWNCGWWIGWLVSREKFYYCLIRQCDPSEFVCGLSLFIWVCISDFLIVLNMRRVLKCILTNDNVGLFWGDPVQLTGGWNQIANLSSEGIKTNYTIPRLKEEGRKLLPEQGFEPRMAIPSHVSSINYILSCATIIPYCLFIFLFFYFRGGGGTFWTRL